VDVARLPAHQSGFKGILANSTTKILHGVANQGCFVLLAKKLRKANILVQSVFVDSFLFVKFLANSVTREHRLSLSFHHAQFPSPPDPLSPKFGLSLMSMANQSSEFWGEGEFHIGVRWHWALPQTRRFPKPHQAFGTTPIIR